MTHVKLSPEELLLKAQAACGEFDPDALVFLDAMLADHPEDNYLAGYEAYIKSMIEFSNDIGFVDEWKCDVDTSHDTYIEVIKHYLLGHTLDPGDINFILSEDKINERYDMCSSFDLHALITQGVCEGQRSSGHKYGQVWNVPNAPTWFIIPMHNPNLLTPYISEGKFNLGKYSHICLATMQHHPFLMHSCNKEDIEHGECIDKSNLDRSYLSEGFDYIN